MKKKIWIAKSMFGGPWQVCRLWIVCGRPLGFYTLIVVGPFATAEEAKEQIRKIQ